MADNTVIDQIVAIKAGTVLMTENERSRKMYIIKEGKVRVFKTYMNQKVTLAVLGSGEIFGELSFFDAEPRSASVEALTDIRVLVIDGDKDLSMLPNWIMPIFKTIVNRFRAADQQLALLQSVYEFQKKGMKVDKISQNIYLEVERFIKSIKLLYADYTGNSKDMVVEGFLYDINDMLGECQIPFKVFWKGLCEHNFIDAGDGQHLNINIDYLDKFNDFLKTEVQTERYLLLSHTSIAILNRLMSYSKMQQTTAGMGLKSISFQDIGIKNIPLYEEGLKELADKGLVDKETGNLAGEDEDIIRLYTFQSILKMFDHTVMNMD
ncbi:MAG: cyclic nucleotide-binding domain-containing protein [Oligoflexia bacterium]|nr:cyclic nucleotide-binding domain-containing protein [Oligoflexia bacterium]